MDVEQRRGQLGQRRARAQPELATGVVQARRTQGLERGVVMHGHVLDGEQLGHVDRPQRGVRRDRHADRRAEGAGLDAREHGQIEGGDAGADQPEAALAGGADGAVRVDADPPQRAQVQGLQAGRVGDPHPAGHAGQRRQLDRARSDRDEVQRPFEDVEPGQPQLDGPAVRTEAGGAGQRRQLDGVTAEEELAVDDLQRGQRRRPRRRGDPGQPADGRQRAGVERVERAQRRVTVDARERRHVEAREVRIRDLERAGAGQRRHRHRRATDGGDRDRTVDGAQRGQRNRRPDAELEAAADGLERGQLRRCLDAHHDVAVDVLEARQRDRVGPLACEIAGDDAGGAQRGQRSRIGPRLGGDVAIPDLVDRYAADQAGLVDLGVVEDAVAIVVDAGPYGGAAGGAVGAGRHRIEPRQARRERRAVATPQGDNRQKQHRRPDSSHRAYSRAPPGRDTTAAAKLPYYAVRADW